MKSPMDHWYEKAGVRRDPRRVIARDLEAGKTLFPEALIPYLDHPLVRALGPDERFRIVTRHLYQYLHFTMHFETSVVNRATERIANGSSGLGVRPPMRLDAYKIYCDEAYHALYSLDAIEQVRGATGVDVPAYDFAPFLKQLDGIGAQVMPGEPVLTQLLQVVVFETLVTSILKDIPKDPQVVDTVREIVGDHAEDEGRHHAYFSGFFKELWTDLDPGMRERSARCLPALVSRSLAPDLAPVRTSLRLAGLGEDAVEQVVADAYTAGRVRRHTHDSARHTVRLFASAGVLDVPGADEAFAAAGLV
ncbi:diiron oxygenase [Streptomyces monomycini]|uniref:diiron oxygenase n=1 Tax=Streptomyces monomycini TaxID=371720 RepID=UPI0004AA7784|nr:diiron oxygenase [Streptomyces monomycini]